MKTNKKRLKILFVPAWYPSKENPVAGVSIKEYAKAVSLYNNVLVLYVSPDPSPKPSRFYQISEGFEDDIKTIRVKYGGVLNYIKTWIARRLLRKDKEQGKSIQQNQRNRFKSTLLEYLKIPARIILNLIYTWIVLVGFRKLLKEGWRPDIIHAHVYSAGVPAVILGKIYKIPVVITEHWTGFPRHILGKLDIFKARFAMNRAKILLPVSQDLKEAIELYGIKNRFQVIPNVINTEMFYPSTSQHRSEKKRILLVALLSPAKGISYLLQALAQLKEKRQDFVLDIVGDGPNRQEYEELTEKLELGGMIRFYGLKSKSEVAEYMRQCDFFVQPSLVETFGVTYIEAMACGKPIVATALPVLQKKISKDRGILVPPKNPNALSEAIDYMLDNYQNYSSENISKYVKENFSYEVVGNRLNGVYRKLYREAKK